MPEPGPGDNARPVGIWLAGLVGKARDRLGFGNLVGKHIAERAELGDIEFAVTHRLDLGGVIRGNEDFDLATQGLAEQRPDILKDRREPCRSLIRLDAEMNGSVIGAILGCGGDASQHG